MTLADRIAAAKQRTTPPPPTANEPLWLRLAREKRLPVRVDYGRTA